MQWRSWKVANPHLVRIGKENINVPLNVKKELEMLAAALIDGCQFSGTKSVEVDTPAQKAAADEELFVLVGNVGRSFSTRCKMLEAA